MTELLQADIKSILNLLLLHLTSHYTRVMAAIKLLATMNQSSITYDDDNTVSRNPLICFSCHILPPSLPPSLPPALLFKPDYLGPHLHGIIAYFNIVLVRLDYFEDSEKGKQVSYHVRACYLSLFEVCVLFKVAVFYT